MGNVAEAGSRNTAVDSQLHRRAWLVLGSPATARAAAREGLLADRRVRAVGHPKRDALERAVPWWPGPDGDPRVVFSTHHSLDEGWTSFGLLDAVRDDMVQWARDGGVSLLWTPHPYLVPFVESGLARISPDELAAWRSDWDGEPAAGTYIGPNYPEVVAASDVVVTDGLSMLIEAQVLGKPVVFLERANHVPFNEAGRLALEGVHRARSVEEARALVDDLVRFGDPLAPRQREIVEELFGPPGAAPRVLRAIREQAREEGWRGVSTSVDDDSYGSLR